MKISYKLAVGGGTYLTLFDEGNPAQLGTSPLPTVNPEFAPSFSGMVQEDGLYSSTKKYRKPIGNIDCKLSLTFQLSYTVADDALASIRRFNALLNALIHLQVVQGSEVQYYPNAVVTGYQSTLQQFAVIHAFQFTSDNLTLVAP